MSVATCQYEFLWITDLACPLNTKNSSVVGFKNCTAINPQTNVLFDLNPLKETSGKDYRVTDQNGHYYLLNVCTGLTSKEGVFCAAYCVKNQGCHGQGKSFFFQGQGKVREFCIKSGKF